MTFRDALDMGAAALDALSVIEKLTHIGGDKAEAALAATRAALSTLRAGLDGKVTPDEVLARIEKLHSELVGNDAAADSALDEKFKDA